MTHTVAQNPTGRFDSEPPDRAAALSLDRSVLAVGMFLPAYLLAATLLAVLGWYSPAFVLIGAVAPAGWLAWMVAKRHTVAVLALPPLAPTVAVVAVIVVVAVMNVVFAGEHLLTDRDPGVYLNTARWIAVHGNLLVDGVTGPFEGISGFTANWTGFYEGRSDGLLYPQFLHMFPSGIAGLKWVFGDVALRMANVPLLAVGLGIVYLLAAQFVRPWFATTAVAASGVSIVAWYFARDAYTEPLVFLLLALAVAAVWVGYRSRTMLPVFVAGVAIGATAGVRIDSWLLLSGFAIAVAVLHVGRIADRSQNPDAVVLAMVTPYVVGLFGLIEGVLRSPGYLSGRLSLIQPMLIMSVLALIVGFVVVASPRWQRFSDVAPWVGELYSKVRWGIAAAVIITFSYLAFVRPLSQSTGSRSARFIAEILEKEGIPGDGFRTMTELTLRWFTWYWGWLGLAVAVAGVMLVLLRRKSLRTIVGIALVVAGPILVAFLLRPSIFGDQPWAMRRFLPSALLLIPLLTAVTLEAMWSWASTQSDRWRAATRSVTIVIAMAVVAVPLWVSLPILDVAHQAGMVRTTGILCAALPENAAVVVSGAPLDTQFGATIRTFCDVPTVATVEVLTPETMVDLAAALGVRDVVPIFVRTEATIPEGWQIVESDVTQYSLVQATATKAPDSVDVVDFRWYASTPIVEGP